MTHGLHLIGTALDSAQAMGAAGQHRKLTVHSGGSEVRTVVAFARDNSTTTADLSAIKAGQPVHLLVDYLPPRGDFKVGTWVVNQVLDATKAPA